MNIENDHMEIHFASHLIHRLGFILFFLVFAACELDPDFKDMGNSELPVAGFSFVQSSNPCVIPCEVNFTSTSQNAQSYFWDFGDGATSQLQNPSHTYEIKGSYNVKLTVTNSAGSDEEARSIMVKEPIPTFFKIFGGNQNDLAYSVIESQDNFYLITGYSNSPDLLNGAGTDHLIIWKFDVLGGKVWTDPRALKPNSYGNSLIEDGSNYVIVGYERNTPGEPMVETPVFVRYNSEGTVVRLRDLSNPIHTFVTYTVLNDILKVGTQYAITGYADLCAPGCPHILLSYLDAEGDVVDETYSTDSFTGNDARGRSIAKSPLRVVSMGDQDGDIIVRENPGINSMQFFDNIFMVGGSQKGNDMVGTNDGNFSIVGNTDNGSNGGVDILFFRIDNDFELIGEYANLGGPVSDFAESVIAHDGDFIIAGSSNSFSSGGDFDIYLLRVNEEGQIVWEVTYENAGSDEFAQEVIATSDGGFMVTGYIEYSNNTRDIFLMKTDGNGEVNE